MISVYLLETREDQFQSACVFVLECRLRFTSSYLPCAPEGRYHTKTMLRVCCFIDVSFAYVYIEPLPSPDVYEWGCDGYSRPTNSSLFAYLWCSSTDLAEEAYMTGFIQGTSYVI